jgi:phosphate transport system permease protein
MAQSLPGNSSAPPPRAAYPPLIGPAAGKKARLTDALFRNGTLAFALTTVVFIFSIAFALFWAARPNFHHSGLHFFNSVTWDPVAPDVDGGKMTGNVFGVLPFVYGTLMTSGIALLIAVPLSIGAAIFLAEIAPRWLSTPVSFLVEMLAAVPSIVYGFWALQFLVPRLQGGAEKWLNKNFGQIPLFSMTPADAGSGQDYLAAGLVLALMVMPFITAVSRDVLRTVPAAQREAAYGMGATKWEAIKGVVLRYASGGIIGAIMLGLGRAIGETMAVTLVIGSSAKGYPVLNDASSFSLFRSGYTLTSVLADQYPSPNSPIHIAALSEVALTLFVVTIIVNALARGLVWLTALKSGGGTASDFSIKAKAFTSLALKAAFSALIALVFLYQISQNVKLHGAAGLFSGASVIGFGLLALVIFNRWVPTTKLFLSWRRFSNIFAIVMSGVCAFIACTALALLFTYVAKAGLSSINAQFFRPPNGIDPDKGGMLHAIVGTGEFVLMASLMGVPLGIMGGLFLSEFGQSKLGFWIRFAADLLNGVPSIVIGIFAYALIIVTTHSNFGIAGGFALGIMMIPTVMRTTEELVRLVPQALREGSLALGATHARTVWQVVLPSARSGIVTGVLLAVARIAGETAPLLMVGCNSNLWNLNPRGQLASLPVEIYVLRDAPTPLALHQLWGVALVLVVLVLILNILARLLTRNKMAAKV